MPIHIVDLAFIVLFTQPFITYVAMTDVLLLVIMTAVMYKKKMALVSETFQAQAAKASLLNETVNNSLSVKSLSLEA